MKNEQNMLSQTTVRTEYGELRGSCENGVTRFFDIPYAQQDGVPGRFGKSVAPDSWNGVRDATVAGPVFPQLPARLVGVMGDIPEFALQSESAFALNVWTPSTSARLPVLFWIHGGGWLSGGGSLRWYHGDELVRSGRVVVVSVNYRLGVLGNLYLPGVADGGMALDDLVMALRWVQANISNFGGDPDSVTIAGQSAGAWYAQQLLTVDAAQGLFARAILLSSPADIPRQSRADALALGRRYCELLEQPLDGSTLQGLPIETILDGQLRLIRDQIGSDWKRGVFAGIPTPFLPLLGEVSASASTAKSIPVLLGYNSEEMAAFYFDNRFANETGSPAVALHFEKTFGADGKARQHEYALRRENAQAYTQLVDLMSDTIFRSPVRRLAASLLKRGGPVYVYQFRHASRKPGLHACHCIELPFFFGNFSNWNSAPMLLDLDPDQAQQVSGAFQGAIKNFVEGGNPNGVGVPAWAAFDGEIKSEIVFDGSLIINT